MRTQTPTPHHTPTEWDMEYREIKMFCGSEFRKLYPLHVITATNDGYYMR